MRVNLYELATRTKVATVAKAQPLDRMALSHDGRLLATSGDDMIIRVWDVLTLQEVGKFEGHFGPVLCLAFSPDGKVLASGSMDSTILLWDVQGLAHRQKAVDLGAKELDRLWADLRNPNGSV